MSIEKLKILNLYNVSCKINNREKSQTLRLTEGKLFNRSRRPLCPVVTRITQFCIAHNALTVLITHGRVQYKKLLLKDNKTF